MQAGQLSSRITVMQKVGSGGYGEPVAWAPVMRADGAPLKLWANIKFQSGSSSIKSDSVTSVARCSIRIRYRQGIVSGMRVLAKGITYNIVSVLPDEAKREHVDLVCEVTDAGN